MNFRRWIIVLISLTTLLFCQLAIASVGKVIIAKGEAYAVDATNVTRPLKRRSEVLEGDTLITGDDSEIHIRFQDNAVLALRAQSQLKISEYHAAGNGSDEKVLMELLSGGFRTITGAFGKTDKEAYQIRTPNASIGIRGTNYEALLSGENLLVGVYQGGVSLNNAAGSINLGLDSAFSFAQVSDAQAPIQGLIEAPAELSTPLVSNSTSALETESEQKSEATAQLTKDDETILTEQLFEGEEQTLAAVFTPEITTPPNSVQAAEKKPDSENSVDDAFNSIDPKLLEALSDVRLSQQQISDLISGAPVGIVVVNQEPTGYRVPIYTVSNDYDLAGNDFYSNGPMTFDVSLQTNDQTFTYTINLEDATALPSVYQSMQEQLKNELGGNVNGVNVPARVQVELVNGKLVFTGITDSGGAEIIIDNFQGSDSAYVAQIMGLCTTTSTCAESYSLGAPSSMSYDHASHFGYVVKGADGPVFANFENESINVLADGYQTPDNVFIGNGEMQLTQFTPLDANADGVDDIDWGYWLASETSPSKLLKDADNLAAAENVTVPHFYASAPPAPQSSLVGQVTMSNTVAWHATTSTQAGLLGSESGTATINHELNIDFSSGEAFGTVFFANSAESWSWEIAHAGKVEGAQYSSDWGFGSLTTNTQKVDAVGHVDGLFTETDTGLGLLGGFGFQSTNDAHHAEGVFLIKE